MESILLCGVKVGRCSRTVCNRYLDFTSKNRSFDVRSPHKHRLPMFLEQNREERQSIQQYAREHLPELSIVLMSEYIHDKLILAMLKTRCDVVPVDENYDEAVQNLLYEHGLKKVCPSTIYNWMKLLGFKYEPRRKGYYVDGLKHPATIEYRKSFVQHYLPYERRMYRWIQVTAEESEELQNKGLVTIKSSYKYKCRDGIDMLEYLVDSCSTFEEALNSTTRFGGHLSVHREPGNDQPLLIFGHDECIFKQYHMAKSAWVAPDGQRVLVPKDDGQGHMISAFQSREFGFGLDICEEDLKKVNEATVGQKYLNEAAANAKRGTAEKKNKKTHHLLLNLSMEPITRVIGLMIIWCFS